MPHWIVPLGGKLPGPSVILYSAAAVALRTSLIFGWGLLRFYSTLLYSTLLYSTLLYSTVGVVGVVGVVLQ